MPEHSADALARVSTSVLAAWRDDEILRSPVLAALRDEHLASRRAIYAARSGNWPVGAPALYDSARLARNTYARALYRAARDAGWSCLDATRMRPVASD